MNRLYLNIDNQTLVQECRSGDRDALSILYTRFAPRMLRVISRYVNDKDSAQDILHDGFVAAFTRLDTLRDSDRLDFWLATIMKNLSLKFLQAQTVSSILEDIPETTDEPDIVQVLDFETLESLIRQLPDGYQKVFRLAVLEGKSHKEISEILGIAPNSSTSQLFHAKLRLRQLINDYKLSAGLLSILLLLVSVGALFFSHNDASLAPTDNLTSETKPQATALPSATTAPGANATSMVAATSSVTASTSRINIPSAIAESQISNEGSGIPDAPSDSTVQTLDPKATDSRPYAPTRADSYDDDDDNDFFLAEAITTAKQKEGWSVGISFDPGLTSFKGLNGDSESASLTTIRPPEISYPGDDTDKDQPSSPDRIARYGSQMTPEDYLSSFSRRHYLPISFALTAEKRLSSWIGIESGIGYSYLHSDYERSTLHSNEVATCHWHYLEFPLKLNLYAYSTSSFKLYGSLGVRAAIPVYSYASIPTDPHCQSGCFSSRTVWSVGGSVGMAFRLSQRIDLFIEPSLRYHFPQDAAIPNIWTDDTPWSFTLPIGFRLSW